MLWDTVGRAALSKGRVPGLLGRTHVPEECSRPLLDCSSWEERCQDWNSELVTLLSLLFPHGEWAISGGGEQRVWRRDQLVGMLEVSHLVVTVT